MGHGPRALQRGSGNLRSRVDGQAKCPPPFSFDKETKALGNPQAEWGDTWKFPMRSWVQVRI